MQIIITPVACEKNSLIALTPAPFAAAHKLESGPLPKGVGIELFSPDAPDEPYFITSGHIWLYPDNNPNAPAVAATRLLSLKSIGSGKRLTLASRKRGAAIAAVTLSDKGSAGLREDKSGPISLEMLTSAIDVAFSRRFLIADDAPMLRGLLAQLALLDQYDLVCTNGGTGVGPRDITPQVTESLVDLTLPGFAQAMMAASLAATPKGAISRACCGIIGKCMVLNLPGSPRAIRENLAPILPALGHALAKIQGDPGECGT